MPDTRPLTILCVSSYEKGREFFHTCKAMGCRVLLLTVEKLRGGEWPAESIDEIFFMPEDLPLEALIFTVSYMARSQPIDRIVAYCPFFGGTDILIVPCEKLCQGCQSLLKVSVALESSPLGV